MDTTLITFHLQTSSSTQSVDLVGSWDNFTKHYPMERDARRAHGQWRGCHTFEDIISDTEGGGSRPKRKGGLKMGQTYYYYYVLADGTETHDSSLPSTTSCPYLPGQTVNLLWVPVEVQPLRYRSASMSSVANGYVKTLNPAAKFVPLRPPPQISTLVRWKSSSLPDARNGSSRSVSQPERPSRSPRLFFGFRSLYALGDKCDRSLSLSKFDGGEPYSDEEREAIGTPGRYSRDISSRSSKGSSSPERSPVRRMTSRGSNTYHMPQLLIPDEIEEEAEDEECLVDNLDRMTLRGESTSLSVFPPFLDPQSPAAPAAPGSTSTNTSRPLPQVSEESHLPLQPSSRRLSVSNLPRSHISPISTAFHSPTSSHSNHSETPSIPHCNFYDDLLVEPGGSGNAFTYDPVVEPAGTEFRSYSRLDGEYAPEHARIKETRTANRDYFGGPSDFTPSLENEAGSMGALDELASEMGYLGEFITAE